MKTKHITYSEAFKRQVVEQIETGKFVNASQAARCYGIRGAETIRRWQTRYGREEYLPKHIKVMSLNEIDETKEMKKRIRALETALADAQMRSLLNESFLNIACKRMDTDPEAFKKKHATTLYETAPQKGAQ